MIRTVPVALVICLLTLAWAPPASPNGKPITNPIRPATIAPQEPTSTSWNLHFYAVPGSDGTSLFASTGQIGQLASPVYATADRGSAVDRDRFAMTYDHDEQAYSCAFDGFFDPGPSLVEGSIRITTTLSTAQSLGPTSNLDTGPVDYRRFSVPTMGALPVVSGDSLLKLTLSDHSLPVDAYAIVMSTNSPPGSAPDGHSFIGQTYSVRPSGAIITSAQPMLLNLAYTTLALGDKDPHTLSAFAWDPVTKQWDDLGGDLDSLIGHQLTSVTERFTVYSLMATIRWRDIFADYTGLSEWDHVSTVPLIGGLDLDGTALTGTAVSRAITPTISSMEWGHIYYTRTVPFGTSLVIDLLASDGSLLLDNVASGTRLDTLDPIAHPSLKLRASFETDNLANSPRLDEWTITWQPKHWKLYLPVVLK
jgi:hypothetical protein